MEPTVRAAAVLPASARGVQRDPLLRLCAQEVLTHPGSELSCIHSRETSAVPGERTWSGCRCTCEPTETRVGCRTSRRLWELTMATGTDKTAAC